MPNRRLLACFFAVLCSVVPSLAGLQCSYVRADGIGGYAVGAGLGFLLGSALTAGRYNRYYYPYNYGNTGSSRHRSHSNDPKVYYGWYYDGFNYSYGPIMAPPAGYTSPVSTQPLPVSTQTLPAYTTTVTSQVFQTAH